MGIGKPAQFITTPSSADVERQAVAAGSSSYKKKRRQIRRSSRSMTDLLKDATFGFDISESLEILIVEDDHVQEVAIQTFLSRHGLNTVCVDCGEDAIKLLQERESEGGGQDNFPGIILMDLMMPGLNGHETTEKIRELFPTVALPIIILTSDEREQTVVEAVRRGANDILTKSHLKGCLIARIAAQLSTLRFWRSKLEAQKNERLLEEILPVSVIQRLNEGDHEDSRLIYDEHEEVSIVFTDIVGFTDLASSVPTRDLIKMLDKLFNCFDFLCDKHGVYKVETIGDAYMVVAGHEALQQRRPCNSDSKDGSGYGGCCELYDHAQRRASEDQSRCAFRSSFLWRGWLEEATILHVWGHGECCQPNGEHELLRLRAAQLQHP